MLIRINTEPKNKMQPCKEYAWLPIKIQKQKDKESSGKLDYYIIEPLDYQDPDFRGLNVMIIDRIIPDGANFMKLAMMKVQYASYAVYKEDIMDKFHHTLDRIFYAMDKVLPDEKSLEIIFPPPIHPTNEREQEIFTVYTFIYGAIDTYFYISDKTVVHGNNQSIEGICYTVERRNNNAAGIINDQISLPPHDRRNNSGEGNGDQTEEKDE